VINNLFFLARVDAGQYPITRAPTYLTDIVSESVKALRTLSEQRDICLSVELPNDDVPYEGDIELLHRLVTNLVENALKHGTPHTTATVALRVFPTEYAIQVTNHAPDIPVSVQQHIFERFVQSSADTAMTELRDRGAGLGLPIAQWVARVHRGRVELLWSHNGTTTFQCSLPRHVG
jgi:signal transduction histidine kinase